MIESLTIITLCVLYLVFFRPGKTPPLSNPLVIDRPGKYHMTLAPHLNLAQPFVEAVAKQLIETPERSGDSDTLYFDAVDKHVTSHGHDNYLLAITQRGGILYFQAAAPVAGTGHLESIREFAQSVLERFPATAEAEAADNRNITGAVQQVAGARQIEVTQLG